MPVQQTPAEALAMAANAQAEANRKVTEAEKELKAATRRLATKQADATTAKTAYDTAFAAVMASARGK